MRRSFALGVSVRESVTRNFHLAPRISRLCASLMKAFEPNKLQFPFFERGNPKRLKKPKLRLRKVVVQKMKEESKGRPTQTHSDNAAK